MKAAHALQRFSDWAKAKADLLFHPPAQAALFAAIENGDAAEVQRCLKSRTSPNSKDRYRRSPLQAAARANSLECVQALLAAKAKVTGMAVIQDAACFSSAEIIQALIQHGADPNALHKEYDDDGMRPILWAARQGTATYRP